MSELDFPVQEYQDRIERLRLEMQNKGLDAIIVLGAENIHYVSGYDCAWTAALGEFSGVIIPLDAEPRLIVRSLESKTIARHWMTESRMYADWEGPWKVLKEVVAECGLASARIGVEENIITAQKLNGLKEVLAEARIVGATGLVERTMAQPSEKEIEFTRRSGEIVQAALEKAIETINKDIPYYKVITEATEAMYQAGMTEQLLFGKYILACVWGGPDGGELHETNVSKRIRKGDLVTPELWGTYRHYTSGAMGTLYVGDNPPRQVKETYKVLAEMYIRIKDTMRPGATVGEVWQAANRVYKDAYGVDYFRVMGLQQGVGLIGRIDRGSTVLKPGMTYLVQPEVTDPLFLCVCASLMVTDTGCEEISRPMLELVTV
jgi:Xaa-Pro dipeptidase